MSTQRNYFGYRFVFSAFCLLAGGTFSATNSYADTINFESGFADGQYANVFHTATNTLSVNATSGRDLFIAKAGDPITAFYPHDTPSDLSITGEYFLTDGIKGPHKRTNFTFDFSSAVDQFSLNIIDLGIKGRSAHLKACSDNSCASILKEFDLTIEANNFNGLVSFLDLGFFIPSTHFELDFFSRNGKVSPVDPGIALDNFKFHTAGGCAAVPEPASIFLFGSSLVGLGLRRRKSCVN